VKTTSIVAMALGVFAVAGAGHAEPVDAGAVLATMRSSLVSKGPLAERVRVSIRQPGRGSRADEYLLKVDPGKKADRSEAVVWMELGELRVFAANGELVAAHTGDLTSCYAVSFASPMKAETLWKLLPPVPAPLVGFVLGDASGEAANVSNGLTPYTPRITWTSAEAAGAPGSEVVTIVGARDAFPGEKATPEETKVTLVIDAATSRPTRFTAVLTDGAELRLDMTPTVPGNASAWRIKTEGRALVTSLTELRERRGDAARASVVPELSLIDGEWNAWEYRNAFGPAPSTRAMSSTHLALIFVRESAADAFGAPSADAKVAEEEMSRAVQEAAKDAGGERPRVRVQVVPVMLTMDDTSRRKVEGARKLLATMAAEANTDAAPLVWAPSAEGTIERFAPGAAAVCVVIRADNSLGGIVVLDGRAKDRDGVRADLRTALAPATPRPDAPAIDAPK
jgi:hypothetical protein